MKRSGAPEPAVDAAGNIIALGNPLARFAPGFRVFHATHGYGVVVETKRTNRGHFVTVYFDAKYVRDILARELSVEPVPRHWEGKR